MHGYTQTKHINTLIHTHRPSCTYVLHIHTYWGRSVHLNIRRTHINSHTHIHSHSDIKTHICIYLHSHSDAHMRHFSQSYGKSFCRPLHTSVSRFNSHCVPLVCFKLISSWSSNIWEYIWQKVFHSSSLESYYTEPN